MFFLLLLFCLLSTALAVDTRTWTLQHSFNAGKDWSTRGELELVFPADDYEEAQLAVHNDDSCWDSAMMNQLMETGVYQLKLLSNEDFVLTTVPACQLRRANFR